MTLDTYSHVTPSLQREAARRIDGLLESRPRRGGLNYDPGAPTNRLAADASLGSTARMVRIALTGHTCLEFVEP